MAQHRSVPCPAQAVAVQTGAIFAGLASGAVNAHMAGIAAMDARREERASQVLAHQLQDAVAAAHDWADYAKRLIRENETLKAENDRLRQVAAQRRGVIERMRAA
ncbi:hypothetical protein CN140_01815 [Sinorhizobium meliloti]|nr:hypothetical protein [Sinorhizobium meliloti]RVL87694.1 hypothetical protein CN140_01815 [Sinorhizobium meliloti]